jgi:tetratricopeptide (TPR) repeat protein
MKRATLILLIIGLCSSLAMPQSSNRLRKMGEEFEENGMYEEAVDHFYRSYIKKTKNIKALIGLERTAPKMLDEEFQLLNRAFANEDYQLYIDKFDELSGLSEKLANIGVDLLVPGSYRNKYESSKRGMAARYYEEGVDYFEQEEYERAIVSFKTCLGYDPSYRDASLYLSEARETREIERAELFYQQGLSEMDQGRYRDAYRSFEKCISYKEGYKDVEYLRNEALELGKVRIGVVEFSNKTRYRDIHDILYAYLVSNAVNCESPFIEVVDRQNLERLLAEQKLGMSGIVDETSASQAGRILGLDFVVMGDVIQVNQTGGKKEYKQIEAYELRYVKDSEGNEVPKGKPVKYRLYDASTSVTIEAKFQLVSIETGRIIADEVMSATGNDYVKYAEYSGDPTKLYKSDPGKNIFFMLGMDNDLVDQRLFNARKQLKKMGEMQGNILKELADRMASGICEPYE